MFESLPRQIFPQGAKIYNEGEASRFAYVIESGAIELSASRQGRKVLLARLGIGEVFGESALAEEMPRSGTAVALEDTQVIVIDSAEFERRLNTADEMVQLVLLLALERFRKTHAVTALSEASVSARGFGTSSGQDAHRLEDDLRQAIAQNELDLHFQPIVSLVDGRVAGFEALIRWQHPDHGTMVPSSFIRLAESTGVIIPIGHWMLSRALEALKGFQAAATERWPGNPALTIHVNVSSRQFLSAEAMRELGDTVRNSGVPPSNVVFEITESLMIEDPDNVAEAMRRLRTLGIRIAADDFGTGYANLAYLNRFPLDALKIDRAFIGRMVLEERSKKIVKTIARLAKDFGMSIIAEGIETPEEIQMLRELGCDYGQGYLLARPVPAAEAETLVKRRVRW